MKQSALEEYTKQKQHYGQNEEQILLKFTQYAEQCSDPMNVYKYMEEKLICIYLSNYWCSRSNLFAEMGDFRDALLCLKEATSRNHIVNENEVNIDEHLERIKKKLLTTMKRHPPKQKRTANEYDFMYHNEEKVTIKNLESLVEIFEKNYKTGKKEIEKEFELKTYGRNKSWLSPIEEQKEENFRKIEEKIKSQGNSEVFLSMRTPISKKDPMRLTKTMDSIEMLKKKKSTQPKEARKNKISENQNVSNNKKGDHEHENEDNISDHNDNEEEICVNTTPVGRDLTFFSRRVTFNTSNPKYRQIEKIRGNDENDSKDGSDIGLRADSEEEVRDKSKSVSKRGSILKNKHAFINMDEDI